MYFHLLKIFFLNLASLTLSNFQSSQGLARWSFEVYLGEMSQDGTMRFSKYRHCEWFTFAAQSMWCLQDFTFSKAASDDFQHLWSSFAFWGTLSAHVKCLLVSTTYIVPERNQLCNVCGASHASSISSCLDFLVKLPSPPFLSWKACHQRC